ncbi:MAG: ABC transporter ATP-binding protein [Burkholderiales bacterium]|nr:ABC transporter ATP-binding protein [Burkholderiales bacterium]
MTALLSVQGLIKRFGGLTATDQVSFEVHTGEIHAIIGPNGAGKTTLISQLAGELRPDEGRIVFEGRDIAALSVPERALAGLGRSYQISQIFHEFTALENVMLSVQAHAGHSFSFFRQVATDPRLTAPALEALRKVGLAHRADARVAALAHGEHRQLELAMTLAGAPRLLLLDEPMAGMSQKESEEMVALIASLKERYGIILVEHDMDAVFALADRISVLVYGRIIFTGTPDEVRGSQAVREAYLGEEEGA